jgi:cycloeucalenol cycloisomerase
MSSSPKPPNGKRPKSPRKVTGSRNTTKATQWYDSLFSPNPDKAWAEKFFIVYSAVWPLLFGGLAFSGIHLHIGDLGNIIASLIIGAPNVLVPLLYAPKLNDGRKWYERFWFKYLLWLFIFTFVATYFLTEYFFDVLGMKYAFTHVKWNFDSLLLGSGKQRVPLMMLVSITHKSR